MTAPHITSTPAPASAHQYLLDLFAGWLAIVPADYTLVAPDEVPEPFRQLLVHHRHMTEVLQHFYHTPVHLSVQWSEASTIYYRRRITLSAGPNGPLVELGAVRLDLSVLPQNVQAEILAESTPLGRILINHNILRRIQPHHYLQIPAASPLLHIFQETTPAAFAALPSFPQHSKIENRKSKIPTPLYGRTGTIFCNEQPAIELLEIVTGTPP